MLDCGEEVDGLYFAANSAFDPMYLGSASVLQAGGRVTGLLIRELQALQSNRKVSSFDIR